jgi:hypothetical protein
MRGIVIAAVVITAAFVWDAEYNYGVYTRGALSMLANIRHSFGF